MKIYCKYSESGLSKLIRRCIEDKIDLKITVGISEKYGTYLLIDKYYASLSFLEVVKDCGLEEQERRSN